MDIPIAIHLDASSIETLPNKSNDLEFQARSLRNSLAVLRNRLKMLKSKEMHTMQDLNHYKDVLEHLEERWRDEEGTFAGTLADTDAPLAKTCSSLWMQCHTLIRDMEEDALEMPAEIRELHWRLVDLHTQLQGVGQREHTSAEVAAIVQQLTEIDEVRRGNGGFFVGDIEAPAPGQAVCTELLAHNFEIARVLEKSSSHDEPEVLRSVADTLRSIRNDVRKLLGQRHHTEADIEHHRFLLMAISSAEAEYADEWRGSAAERLLAECLQMVEGLEATAEPMPPQVKQVYDRLKMLKRELSSAAASSSRSGGGAENLKRWKEDVDAIDEERAASGGVFGGVVAVKEEGGEDGSTSAVVAPPGQFICNYLLDECYRLLHQLSASER